MALELKPKQQSVIDVINNHPEIDELVLIGPTGVGKSALAAHVFITMCDAFPMSQIFIWRKNFGTARKTIWRTYKKMLADMNMVEEEHYHLNEGSLLITFPNNSTITFGQADSSTDKDQNKIKGLDITASQIEEANELTEDAVDMIMSRKGRANQQGQPSINILTMNPNNGWTKTRYYDKWKKGQLPPNVMVIEFTLEDSWQTPKKPQQKTKVLKFVSA
jgi:phage terminase large subunit